MLAHAHVRTSFENVLCERSQARRTTCCMTPLRRNVQSRDLGRQEADRWWPRAPGWGVTAKGGGFSRVMEALMWTVEVVVQLYDDTNGP